MNKPLKFSVTIDCDESGKVHVWSQQKEAIGTTDVAFLESVKEAVRRMIREKNQEIIHKPPEESAA